MTREEVIQLIISLLTPGQKDTFVPKHDYIDVNFYYGDSRGDVAISLCIEEELRHPGLWKVVVGQSTCTSTDTLRATLAAQNRAYGFLTRFIEEMGDSLQPLKG